MMLSTPCESGFAVRCEVLVVLDVRKLFAETIPVGHPPPAAVETRKFFIKIRGIFTDFKGGRKLFQGTPHLHSWQMESMQITKRPGTSQIQAKLDFVL
ncbi:hypothetical protein ACFQ88_16455 [Paenibacillus sp. NPDC056579]|uniref:hypothetical protein n=1 Tax=Paenibacillus sp. NPDC056579 TaxID=3345871 RepID=UPI00367BE070